MMRRLSQWRSRRQGGGRDQPRTTQNTWRCRRDRSREALVAANRELITRFEKKIRVTLARVWGEDVVPSVEL
jgi:hypothetical protein